MQPTTCVCVCGGGKTSHNHGLDNQMKGETRVIHPLELVINQRKRREETLTFLISVIGMPVRPTPGHQS